MRSLLDSFACAWGKPFGFKFTPDTLFDEYAVFVLKPGRKVNRLKKHGDVFFNRIKIISVLPLALPIVSFLARIPLPGQGFLLIIVCFSLDYLR